MGCWLPMSKMPSIRILSKSNDNQRNESVKGNFFCCSLIKSKLYLNRYRSTVHIFTEQSKAIHIRKFSYILLAWWSWWYRYSFGFFGIMSGCRCIDSARLEDRSSSEKIQNGRVLVFIIAIGWDNECATGVIKNSYSLDLLTYVSLNDSTVTVRCGEVLKLKSVLIVHGEFR